MSLHQLQPQLDGPDAEARLAEVQKRFRDAARRASRAAYGKRQGSDAIPLWALLFVAACIGAAAFAVAQTVLARLFWV